MALYPNARQRPIAPGANDPAITVIGAILHVDAANSKSLYGYFNGPSGGIESHFHVPKDLQVEQYRDTGREADANYKANSFTRKSDPGKRFGFVSIETQGFGTGEWNAHQLAEIKALLLWLSKTHNFPLRRCSGPFESGVGYHTMWGAPSEWTPVAKSCPGPDRIRQFASVLVPWFATASKPPAPPSAATPPKGNTLTAAEAADAQAAHIHAKSSAIQTEALLSRLSLTVPPRPTVTGDGETYYAHYWAKRAAELLPLAAAELARLGFPKKV